MFRRIRQEEAGQDRQERASIRRLRLYRYRCVSTPKSTESPLSLQDLCLLRVINDVDSYPEELLASLPRWLRSQLLNNLPVLDLCRLDSTLVATGVDVNKIWSTRPENEPYKKSIFCHTRRYHTQPSFIENLFQMSVHRSNITRNDKVPRIARLKTDTELAFQSCRNKAKFTENKEGCLMKLTANALSCSDVTTVAPKLISINGTFLSQQLGVGRNVWNTQATSLAVSAPKQPVPGNRLLERRTDMYLTPHRLLPICKSANSIELLSILTHTCRVRPTSVCLDVDMISQPIRENLQVEKIAIDNGLPVAPEKVSCLSIMKCLMDDVVILRVQSVRYLHITGPMLTLIEVAMGNGKLKSLFCSMPNLYMETVQLLSSLFLNKHFHMLHLEIDSFSPQTMITLLQAFMTVPCELMQKLVINISENIKQLKFLTKEQLGSLSVSHPIPVPECALDHKILQSYPQNHVLQFLLLLPCVRLTELELNCSSGMAPYFHLCACHPNLQVKMLVLNLSKCATADENELIKATIENDLLLLLNKPSLQELHITGDWEGYPEAKQGLLYGLLQGLHQQNQPNFQLRNLTLDMIGYRQVDILVLLKAVFSFPLRYQLTVYQGKTFLDAAKATGVTYDRMYRMSPHGYRLRLKLT